jgi:PhnB protein
MTHITPYIHFNGNCQEAFNFYKECLGGELMLQTVGESPMAEQMPHMKEKVMHASLANKSIMLMGSDMMSSEGALQGNNISLCINNAGSEEEVRTLFEKLSSGASIKHPLKEEFWGALYGDFTDKFGINWMFNFDKNQKTSS